MPPRLNKSRGSIIVYTVAGVLAVLMLVVMLGDKEQTSLERKTQADKLVKQGIHTSQLDASLQSFQQALTLYREIKDRKNEGWVLVNIAATYGKLGNYDKSIEYSQQSLMIARETQDRQTEKYALLTLGGSYSRLRNYDKSIEYSQQSLMIARETQDKQIEEFALKFIDSAQAGQRK